MLKSGAMKRIEAFEAGTPYASLWQYQDMLSDVAVVVAGRQRPLLGVLAVAGSAAAWFGFGLLGLDDARPFGVVVVTVVVYVYDRWVRSHARPRIVLERLCFCCGFSLRMTRVEANGFGRCPECGRLFAPSDYEEPVFEPEPSSWELQAQEDQDRLDLFRPRVRRRIFKILSEWQGWRAERQRTVEEEVEALFRLPVPRYTTILVVPVFVYGHALDHLYDKVTGMLDGQNVTALRRIGAEETAAWLMRANEERRRHNVKMRIAQEPDDERYWNILAELEAEFPEDELRESLERYVMRVR